MKTQPTKPPEPDRTQPVRRTNPLVYDDNLHRAFLRCTELAQRVRDHEQSQQQQQAA
jgi:hypothetical protein